MLQVKSYKKKDGNTYYKFQTYLGKDEFGKNIRATRQGFVTKSDARKEAMRLKSEFQESGYQKKTYETFKEIYELWFDTIYKSEVKESTSVKTQELFKNHVLKDFGHIAISNITPQQCQSAVTKWAGRITKAKQMKNYCLKIFDFSINQGLIKGNPMERVHVPKKKKDKKREVNFYDKAELQRFLECAKQEANEKWYVLFRLLGFTGARKGEMLGLQWKNINFENNTITIDQTLSRGENNRLIIQTTKTTAGERTITMDATTMSILKQWRTQQRLDYLKLGHNTNTPNQYVFTNMENGFIQHAHVTTVMNRIIKKGNLKKITVHQLRHSHCSLLFDAGAKPMEVKERLGHSSIDVTLNIYAHVTDEKKDDTANVFAQYMGF